MFDTSGLFYFDPLCRFFSMSPFGQKSRNTFCPNRIEVKVLQRHRKCAPGVSKGVALCAGAHSLNAPWSPSFGTFLGEARKVHIPLKEFCTPKFLHSPCGMWKTFLWKTVTKKILPQCLWKSSSFQHLPCGEKSVAALMQNGLFHIILYYHCYD